MYLQLNDLLEAKYFLSTILTCWAHYIFTKPHKTASQARTSKPYMSARKCKQIYEPATLKAALLEKLMFVKLFSLH